MGNITLGSGAQGKLLLEFVGANVPIKVDNDQAKHRTLIKKQRPNWLWDRFGDTEVHDVQHEELVCYLFKQLSHVQVLYTDLTDLTSPDPDFVSQR